MTPKELREYEEGKVYGQSHPGKVHGWLKSPAWNHGLKAGQAQYRKEARERSEKGGGKGREKIRLLTIR